MNLGIAELSVLRRRDARGHLQQALELARRIGRPYLEIGCLGHLAMEAPLSGLPASVALELSEQAVAIAREHGWTDDPVAAAALVIGAAGLTGLVSYPRAAHAPHARAAGMVSADVEIRILRQGSNVTTHNRAARAV
jgi:LuxR family maltose regulon positive regulatory protein